MMSHFCLVALKILSLSLTFDNLLITCHGMDSLGSPFCNVLWLLESEYLLPFPDMGLSPIISSNKISNNFLRHTVSNCLTLKIGKQKFYKIKIFG